MTVCLDASVLVSLFIGDVHSERAEGYLLGATSAIVVSDFASAEFSSAINRLVRMSLLSPVEGAAVFSDFDGWRSRSVQRETVVSDDVATADAYLRRLDLNLRTGDALNIAVASRIGAELATFDMRMADSARTLGLLVA